MVPTHLLPGARSVVAFLVPFDPIVVQANARDRRTVAREWALAYVETNELISRATDDLVDLLAEHGVRAAAELPTDNFASVTLISRWSHKSVAMIAGLGSFGLHHMLIIDAGCAGHFRSVVTDVELPSTSRAQGALSLLLRRQLSGMHRPLLDRGPE
jgi:epoxyqueuosine reductase QueG